MSLRSLHPKLEPGLIKKGLMWNDALPVLDGITIELLQQSVKDGIIMEKLLDASGPLLKKYLIGKLRPKLEPRLKKEGLVWEDALPVLDGITIELLQQCVKEGSPEPIMEELTKVSGPLFCMRLCRSYRFRWKSGWRSSRKRSSKVRAHTHIHTYTYTCTHIHTHVHIYMHMYIQTHAYLPLDTCTPIHAHALQSIKGLACNAVFDLAF